MSLTEERAKQGEMHNTKVVSSAQAHGNYLAIRTPQISSTRQI